MKFHPVTLLLDLIYPPKCVLCGKLLTRQQHDFCDSCRKTLPVCDEKLHRTDVFDGITAALWYQGAVRGSILRYKFSGRSHYSRCYGRLLAAACVRLPLEEVDAVTWIPVSRRRRWRRGYDQSKLLAAALAKALDKPLVSTLRKTKHNPPQSTLTTPEERRANVLGVYRAVGHGAAGKRLLLVDDVWTTGATATEAGRTLLLAGADTVWMAALARSREFKENEQVKPC